MTSTENGPGRAVLTLAHIAGMIDLVALPVWVGTSLIGQYHFSPSTAGAMVTAYLVAVASASLIFAPRFHRVEPAKAAPLGFAIAAVAFAILTRVTNPTLMFALHVLAGFSAGAGLSFTHGTIGRSLRPHRLFAIVTLGLGVSGIIFLGVAQSVVPLYGGYVLFIMFAVLMSAAALATGFAYPRLTPLPGVSAKVNTAADPHTVKPIAARIWWAIAGVTLMAVTQAMLFSFLERIGTEHGYMSRVQSVLVVSAFINLAAAGVAGLLERRFEALKLALFGAVIQAALAMTIAFSSEFWPYAISGVFLVSAMIITHTFVFGWLSANDASGRAVALTPAMLMTGAALGPITGGALVEGYGWNALGITAAVLGCAALSCYFCALRMSRATAALQFDAV